MVRGAICQGNWRLLYYVVFSLTSILLYGCATTMEVTPQVAPIDNVNFRIKGKVIYEGNKEYLPRVIIDESVSNAEVTFQYSYNAIYGKHDVPAIIALYNPLDIVGFPTGGDELTIVGKLDILKGVEIIKSYAATCILKKARSLYSTTNFSELRKKGLITVRDNIEAQMYQDKDFLNQFLTAY